MGGVFDQEFKVMAYDEGYDDVETIKDLNNVIEDELTYIADLAE